jgi:hypothetical protein
MAQSSTQVVAENAGMIAAIKEVSSFATKVERAKQEKMKNEPSFKSSQVAEKLKILPAGRSGSTIIWSNVKDGGTECGETTNNKRACTVAFRQSNGAGGSSVAADS